MQLANPFAKTLRGIYGCATFAVDEKLLLLPLMLRVDDAMIIPRASAN